ncbi:MAG: ABC transporter ATP-binding protein, partial [Ruminiclostridium sp.]|nr:ABC transporter ATP-binding protein [Ruminiclostridium sp.]
LSVKAMVLHGRFSHLSYPRCYRNEDIRAAEKAMRTVGIQDLADKSVTSLSGGTVQLVFLAMALAQDSPVILMDEPASFLDIGHQIRLMELCKTLADDGKAVVMVLHDIPLTLKYAHEIAVMQEGSIAVTGTPAEVFESGALDKVFGVRVRYADTENGGVYFCE